MTGERLSDGYSIAVGDVAADGEQVLQFYLRSLEGFTSERYAKYFVRNPLGSPAFVVVRDSGGAVVGAAGFHPSEMLVEGEVRPVAVAGDFAVAEGLRGFGPALALQRRLLPLLESRGWDFAYGLPNPPARAVLRRVGYRDLGELIRFERRIGTRERVAGALRGSLGVGRRSGPRLLEAPAEFDERFAGIWAASPRAAYLPRRTVGQLNWQYELDQATPSRFSVTAAIAADGVAAYSVSHVLYGTRRIVDLAWLDDESLRAVLRFDLMRAAQARLVAVDLLYLGRHEVLLAALAPLGFVALPAPHVTTYAANDRGAAFADPRQWELFEGAADV